MKILQLIPHLRGGGAERFTVDLSNTLSTNHNLSILTLYDSTDKDFFRKELSGNITTYSVGKEWGFDYKVFRRLYNTINKIKPDIIHSHLRSINYLMAMYPFLNKIPVVYTVHNDAFKDCPSSMIRIFRKQLFRREYVTPVTISDQSQNSFQQAYGNLDSNLIFNGRAYPEKSKLYSKVVEEIEGLKFNRQTKISVHIGRMAPQKNQLMLIKAFIRLVENNNANAILLVIGRERNNNASRRIQQKLKETDKTYEYIHILGERSNATDYLHAADYFCLSSKYEGMPITLIEAFAAGCIPVCTNAGGIPEMIADLEPSLIPGSQDIKEYYKLLKRAIKMPDSKLERIGHKAIELFHQKYSIKYSASKYLSLYEEITHKC